MAKARSDEENFNRNSGDGGAQKPADPTHARKMYLEQRSAKRFRLLEHDVSVQKPGLLWGLKKNLAKCVLDLSLTGARVHLLQSLHPGDQVTVQVRVTKFDETVQARAIVRWVKPFETGVQVGLKFMNIDETDRAKLRRLEGFFADFRFEQKT